MYNAKVGGMATYGKKFGEKIDAVEKWICGIICVGLFLFFLVGPFLIFSNLKSIASYNLVTDASINFNIEITDASVNERYEFPLFSASNPLSMDTISLDNYKNETFDEWP